MAANQKPTGIAFPLKDGARPSTDLNKQVWADSAAAVDTDLANQMRAEKNWRFKYAAYAEKHLKTSLLSYDNAVKMAQAGLDSIYNNMTFIRNDTEVPLTEALKTIKGFPFSTFTVKGEGVSVKGAPLKVPYKDKVLTGKALHDQLDKWARYGTIEPDTAESIKAISDSVDISDLHFVLIGAGAAMGPFISLMNLGANVVALDIDRKPVWDRLIGIARKSPGTLIMPTKKELPANATDAEVAEVAGCDLMQQTPEVANWVASLPFKNMVLGCYVYLDGEAHVRVALASDAVMKRLTEERKTPIAFLCTPTDLHVIPKAAHEAAKRNYASTDPANLFLILVRTLWRSALRSNVTKTKDAKGREVYYVNGLVVPQGPNYALAKRMQHWRVIVAREAGCVVSSNIAPSTATRSVVSNKQFAWAYDGMPFIKPYEVFEEGTSNAVMAALLINDLKDSRGPAHPKYKLENPLELFSHNGFHGGVWRSGYKFDTIGAVAVMIHFLKVGRPIIALLLVVIAYFLFA